jgi:hypothetical protein
MIYESSEDYNQMNDLFDESYEIKRRKEFSNREVGLTHPDNSSFLRIADGGAIEIFACPGVGIVINPGTRSISFFADTVKFYCKDDDGLRWNSMSFNPASDMYNEPALIKTNGFANNPAYHNAVRYLNNLEDLEQSGADIPVTIGGEYGFAPAVQPVEEPSDRSGENFFSPEVQLLIDGFASTNSDTKVQKLIGFIQSGYSFSQSLEKVNQLDYNDSENLENFPWIDNDVG